MPWDYSGPHWKKSVRQDTHRKPMALKYRACADPLEFARRSRRSSRSRRNSPRTTVQDLPSTRAGDQDDVSFTNSLKRWTYYYNTTVTDRALAKQVLIGFAVLTVKQGLQAYQIIKKTLRRFLDMPAYMLCLGHRAENMKTRV